MLNMDDYIRDLDIDAYSFIQFFFLEIYLKNNVELSPYTVKAITHEHKELNS